MGKIYKMSMKLIKKKKGEEDNESKKLRKDTDINSKEKRVTKDNKGKEKPNINTTETDEPVYKNLRSRKKEASTLKAEEEYRKITKSIPEEVGKIDLEIQ